MGIVLNEGVVVAKVIEDHVLHYVVMKVVVIVVVVVVVVVKVVVVEGTVVVVVIVVVTMMDGNNSLEWFERDIGPRLQTRNIKQQQRPNEYSHGTDGVVVVKVVVVIVVDVG